MVRKSGSEITNTSHVHGSVGFLFKPRAVVAITPIPRVGAQQSRLHRDNTKGESFDDDDYRFCKFALEVDTS